MGGFGCGFEIAQMTIEIRGLDDDGRGIAVDMLQDVALAIGGGREADEIGIVLEIGANDIAVVGVETTLEDDFVLACQASGHEHGFGGTGRAVIKRRIGDIHAGDLGHLRLELKQHLQRALRDLRLVGRICRKPFRTLD